VLSANSNYGGNAIGPKKHDALRLSMWDAQDKDQLVEHMAVWGLEVLRDFGRFKKGETIFFAGGFPSYSGKTTTSTLQVPKELEGFVRTWMVADDIPHMRLDERRRLLAANADGPDVITIRSTFRRTSSAASSGSRSSFCSANRYSIVIFFPSIQPSLRSSCRNASKRTAIPEAVLPSRKPMRKIFPACCARAGKGRAKSIEQKVRRVIFFVMGFAPVFLLASDL
jgi:hypothetical protein